MPRRKDRSAEYRRRVAIVTDAPDTDDRPRLELADWLENVGGDPARGEFIRVEVAHRRLLLGCFQCPGATGFENEVLALRNRARTLWSQHSARWVAPLLAVLGAPARDVVFSVSRGMVCGVTSTHARISQRVLDRADDLLQMTPINTVRLWGGARGALRRVSIKGLTQTRPFASRLRTLDLSGCEIGDAGAGVLWRAVRSARLSTLILRGDTISHGMLRRLYEKYAGCLIEG